MLLPCSPIFAIAERKEHHASTKFYFLPGKTATKTVLMLQTVDKGTVMTKILIYEWLLCLSLETSFIQGNHQPPEPMKT